MGYFFNLGEYFKAKNAELRITSNEWEYLALFVNRHSLFVIRLAYWSVIASAIFFSNSSFGINGIDLW
jgi:hypothetical protein